MSAEVIAMFRMLMVAALAAVVGLAGCASTREDPGYTSYLEFVERAQAAQDRQLEVITGMASGCQDDACRTHIAALAALSQAAGGSSRLQAQPPPQRTSTGEKVAMALIGQLSPLAGAYVSLRASDNARDVSLGQFDFLGGVIADVVASPALRAPSITVGGDYVPGRVGDNVGGDQVGGDQHHGDAIGGDQVGRDMIGGDRVDGDGNYNEGRYYSPGPFDESGDRCEGDGCQGTNNPPPADPEG